MVIFTIQLNPTPPKVVDLGPSHKDMNLNLLGLTSQLKKLANVFIAQGA
jgi:hypothetical protein